jgi:ADP-ribose pyrophosphatase YjhB (NUDIX family)
VIVQKGQSILLGRRARGQYKGAWCILCGHLEWGEEVRFGAQREFLEEPGFEVEIGPVFTVHSNFHDPQTLTVGIWFRGSVIGGSLQAGDNLDAVDYFPLDALPEHLMATSVTGGMGFAGSHIMKTIAHRGHQGACFVSRWLLISFCYQASHSDVSRLGGTRMGRIQ